MRGLERIWIEPLARRGRWVTEEDAQEELGDVPYIRADIAADRIAALEARLAELTGEAMVERMEQAIAAAWPGAFESHRIKALARDLLTRAGIVGGDAP